MLKNPIRTVSAKEFIEHTKNDLHDITGKIHYYQNSFAKVDAIFGETQTAFYEISTKHSYIESVNDTTEDIKQITKLLHAIGELKSKRKLTKPPKEFESLAQNLETYYNTIESALEKLLIHEKTQAKLLELSTRRYNQLLDQLSATHESYPFINLILEINPMAQKIADDLEHYPIPSDEKAVFIPVIAQHRLQADTFKKLADSMHTENPLVQPSFTTILTDYQTKIEIIQNSHAGEVYVASSPTATDFQKALQLEKKIYEMVKNIEDTTTIQDETTPKNTQDVTPVATHSSIPTSTPTKNNTLPQNQRQGKGKNK